MTMTMQYAKGSSLKPSAQREALSRFVHRFTMEHVPSWALRPLDDGRHYAPAYASDREWLACTTFAITKSGDMDQRARFCQSGGQSFPLGKFLAAPYRRDQIYSTVEG